MNDYYTALGYLQEAIRSGNTPAKDRLHGGNDLEGLTTDQQLKAAEVAALISISQELSAIRNAGINPDYIAG